MDEAVRSRVEEALKKEKKRFGIKIFETKLVLTHRIAVGPQAGHVCLTTGSGLTLLLS